MPRLYHLLICIFLILSFNSKGQDEHFSLFHRAPLHYNPALTGISDYELRGGINYRSQWASIDKPFTTMSAFADRSMAFGPDRVAGGILLMNDRTGMARLNTSKLMVSAAYHKRIGSHYISGAIQPGFVFQSIKNPTLPSGYDPSSGGFNPDPSFDNTLQNPAWFDLGAGVAYQYKKEEWKVGAGQSFLHLTSPNNSFLDDPDEQLSMRLVTSFWAQFNVGPGSIHPRVIFMNQQNASEAMLSVSYDQMIEGELYGSALLTGGLAFRNNFKGADDRAVTRSMDAMAILFGVGWENYQLDMAYDFNITDLSEASGYRGAFELALTYTMGFIPTIQKITVPCIRY